MSVDDFIRNGISWLDLPNSIQLSLNKDEAEYDARIFLYFLQNQLEYSGTLITKVMPSEKAYYGQLVHYCSQRLMLFPYHLQRKIVAGLKITPFDYYRNIIFGIMLTESSYDRIPNFTAADSYQVVGIGRNEYIDLLNTYKGILCSQRTYTVDSASALAKRLLPKQPLDCKIIEPWFIVRVSSISLSDIEASTEEERALLDRIIDHDAVHFSPGNEHSHMLHGIRVSDVYAGLLYQLYRRGLIYFDVPIFDDDCISVRTLDGFIMNRITDDSCERMLYKIFVSLDPNSSVGQLAVDLNVRVDFVRNAASVFCRLGFAHKISAPILSLPPSHSSTQPIVLKTDLSRPSDSVEEPFNKRIAFIFDSTITAYLMLGNLSADLKKHSVTMFEVGKLTGDSLLAFYDNLKSVSQSSDQDVCIYFEHARCLSQTMRHIAKSSADGEQKMNLNCFDLIRCGSLETLEPVTRSRILSKNYDLLICMAPLSYEEAQVFSPCWPLTIGPPTAEASSPWFRFFLCHTAGEIPARNALEFSPDQKSHIESRALPSILLCRGCKFMRLPKPLSHYSHFLVTSWGHDPVLMDAYTLFNSVNDLLPNSPVLIQAYDDCNERLPLKQSFLPLPLSDAFLLQNCVKLQWLENLSIKIDLKSLVGYISILIPDDSESARSAREYSSSDFVSVGTVFQTNNSQFLENTILMSDAVLSESDFEEVLASGRSIVFLTLHLGIPLFNSVLNNAVFANLSSLSVSSCDARSSNLLSESLRATLFEANKSLRCQLSTFIQKVGGMYLKKSASPDTYGSTDRKSMSTAWPLPTKSYCSHDGNLIEWDC